MTAAENKMARIGQLYVEAEQAMKAQDDVSDGMFRKIGRIRDEGLREEIKAAFRSYDDNNMTAMRAFMEATAVTREMFDGEPKRLSSDPADYLPDGFEVVDR